MIMTQNFAANRLCHLHEAGSSGARGCPEAAPCQTKDNPVLRGLICATLTFRRPPLALGRGQGRRWCWQWGFRTPGWTTSLPLHPPPTHTYPSPPPHFWANSLCCCVEPLL